MNPSRLARLIHRTGRVAEPAPPRPGSPTAGSPATDAATAAADDAVTVADGFVPPRELRGSAQVRHVDAGSCNGCEVEIASVFGPVHDAERYGVRMVASPRHADVVLVTGVVTKNMEEPLRRTVEATPRPRVVVAVGDCARDCGLFKNGYGVAGPVDSVVPVDVSVAGCPPEPDVIVDALRRITER